MPATLMALRDAGWRIVNLACGLGRPAQHQRRRAEVEEACRRAGFELLPCEPPLALSARRRPRRRRGDARRRCSAPCCRRSIRRIVCAPSPHDGHHAHELVGRAARRALEAHPGPTPPLWLWGIWADLPFPTMIAPFDRARLAEIKHALAAHASEQARLPLDRLIEARAVLNAGVGEERVYGSGLAGDPAVELRRAALRGRAASRPAGSSARRGASMPRRRSPRPRRARSAGGSRPSRCTTACARGAVGSQRT